MKPSNLAVCIGPNLLSKNDGSNMLSSLGDIPRVTRVVTVLISFAPQIFRDERLYNRRHSLIYDSETLASVQEKLRQEDGDNEEQDDEDMEQDQYNAGEMEP